MNALKKAAEAILVSVLILAAGTLVAILASFPTKWIVNHLFSAGLLTAIFGAAKIGASQAFWLNCLCDLLFTTIPQSKTRGVTASWLRRKVVK